MPEDRLVQKYIRIGDGPDTDVTKVDDRIRLFMRIITMLDKGAPSMETLVALATLKVMAENELGHNVDVQLQVGDDADAEKLRERLQRLHDLGLPIDTPDDAIDPSVH